MFIPILTAIVVACVGKDDPTPAEFIKTVLSLHDPYKTIHCEFEGRTFQYDLKDDGPIQDGNGKLADTFSGSYAETSQGDAAATIYVRSEADQQIREEQIVTHESSNTGMFHKRLVNEPLGKALADDLKMISTYREQCIGRIMTRNILRTIPEGPGYYLRLSEEVVDQKPLHVLSVYFDKIDQLFYRFWIDMRAGGHVVRCETYGKGEIVRARSDIMLGSFTLDGKPIWYPIRAKSLGNPPSKNGKAPHPDNPTWVEDLYIIDGSLEFNTRLPSDTFKMKVRPGTPVSDNLRKLQYEFGQQKPAIPKAAPGPSKSALEASLKEDVKQAEEQARELVAIAPDASRLPWATWLTWGFGSMALAVAAVVLYQRSRS